jgi:PleD family two-component response regulator
MTPDHNSKATILIVDDNPANIRILAKFLNEKYNTMAATNGRDALEAALSENKPDLILLDIMMPDLDGYEVCKRLKKNASTRDIPVIFITALKESTDKAMGLKLGAVDYISKPFHLDIVEARVSTHIELVKSREHLDEMTKRQVK